MPSHGDAGLDSLHDVWNGHHGVWTGHVGGLDGEISADVVRGGNSIHVFREGDSMSKAVHVVIFAFIVGGLVGYGTATTQALNHAVAAANAVPIPDARQVELHVPTPMQACDQRPASQSTAVTPMAAAAPTEPSSQRLTPRHRTPTHLALTPSRGSAHEYQDCNAVDRGVTTHGGAKK